MRLYKLNAGQLTAIAALNSSRENTLLIICDHDNGNIGVDADALQAVEFIPYLAVISGGFDEGQVATLQLDADGLISQ